MQIVIEGNTVKAVRITGPQHHFLKVVFSESPEEIMFFNCSNELRGSSSGKHEVLLQNVMASFQDIAIINNVTSVAYDAKDTLNTT